MRIILLFLLVSISVHGFSQKHGQELIDSLKIELPKAKSDTAAVKLYLLISDIYIDVDLDKALLFADTGSTLARKAQWQEGIAKSQINYGNVYNFTGRYKEAIEQAQQAYAYFKKQGDKKNAGVAAYTIGVAEERMGNYSKAAERYFEALHIFETIKGEDRLTGNSLSAIAVVYFLQRDYKKSIEYSFQALAKQEAANNTMGVANEYIAMADTYNELHDSANAIKYNLAALAMQQKMGNKFAQALIYFQLGKLYHSDYARSLDYHLKSEKLFSELSDNSNFATFNRGEIGRLYFEAAQGKINVDSTLASSRIQNSKATLLQLAEKYLRKSVEVSRETGDKDNQSVFSATLAELQFYKGDYKNAYLNFRLFHETQDSIYSQENKNKIAALESQKEIDLKNKTIENKELQLINQRNRIWLLVLGTLFFIAMGAGFYYQSLKRKKINATLLKLNSELDEANKIKAKFFGILSHDLRSPVASLINFLQLQKRKKGILTPEQIIESENSISESAKSLLDNMEGILLWSKGQMQQFKPSIQPVPIDEIFTHLKTFYSDNTHIKFEFSNPGAVLVNTDENYLKTILRNLSSNAIKAVQSLPNAHISWKAWQENNQVFISITDNGPGISEEKLAALYDGNTNYSSGSGMGLYIIKDLAKSIGANIRHDKDWRQGTRFILTLA